MAFEDCFTIFAHGILKGTYVCNHRLRAIVSAIHKFATLFANVHWIWETPNRLTVGNTGTSCRDYGFPQKSVTRRLACSKWDQDLFPASLHFSYPIKKSYQQAQRLAEAVWSSLWAPVVKHDCITEGSKQLIPSSPEHWHVSHLSACGGRERRP